jgi:hypothetical protein
MISFDVWQGLDCLAFHENAILLDVAFGSQGVPIRSAVHNDNDVESQDGLTPQLARNVLDDFALVLSGRGGKENVSAVCMEHDEELRTITLRSSRNDGIDKQKRGELEGLLQLITRPRGSGTELRCDQVFTAILQQCRVPFLKHVNKFSNELKNARCPPDTHLRAPSFSTQDGTSESPADTGQLGAYDETSHQAYMRLCSERLSNLRRMCLDLTEPGHQPAFSELILLAKAAYEVRRSSSFGRFLRHNLLANVKSMAAQSLTQGLKERLGKISRYWRAAIDLTAFGEVVLAQTIAVNVSCLPASRQKVHELRQRTLHQLQSRGGRDLQSCHNVQLRAKLERKLKQWPEYRLHCELQLVVFYQENPHLRLRSRYIGCSKLACYLCYNFITTHGEFHVKGCHQGLYSLWTVPHTIDFENNDRALQFQRALRQLARTLEIRVDTIRKVPKSQWKYRTNHESTANLSRISLPLPTATRDPPTTTQSTVETSNERSFRPSFLAESFRSSENPGRGLHSEDVVQNGLAQNGTPGTTADIDPETDISKQPPSQLDPVLPMLAHTNRSVSNVSAEAVISTTPLVSEDETDRKDASVISRGQSKELANGSREIGLGRPGPRRDLTSCVPQASNLNESKNAQFGDGRGAEGYVTIHSSFVQV